jgi:uncharacterized FAD-dependent dehydrogenase
LSQTSIHIVERVVNGCRGVRHPDIATSSCRCLEDLPAGRCSIALGSVVPSYQPGITITDLSAALLEFAIASIREALPVFDKLIRSFTLPDAVLTALEK